ncbi:Pkinase-domain-containing protein, partial [Hesseltinella vesiculosa]
DPKDSPTEREQRTKREMTIMQLLHHPHICSLDEWACEGMLYYFFIEYVDGGQLLDYIIQHGKLKEKQARKFARQIASALDYCHQNAIVHRDLKIENILITRDENIKIIDFGLSNFYSSKTTLNTYCGSLYFAAPELLRARGYVGPEVDIWSFGVVLFVMVCGRVPFDDTSLPVLHQKIKMGVVQYPDHLSKVDPQRRETMTYILNHPWMKKNYGNNPIQNHLPGRQPLDSLDSHVIQRMHTYGFGLPEDIHDRLRRTVASHEYQYAKLQLKTLPLATPPAHTMARHRTTPLSPEASSPSTYATFGINGYDPLLSIYYLVHERMKRERGELVDTPGPLSALGSSSNLTTTSASSSTTSLHRSSSLSFFRSSSLRQTASHPHQPPLPSQPHQATIRRSSSLIQRSKSAAKRL